MVIGLTALLAASVVPSSLPPEQEAVPEAIPLIQSPPAPPPMIFLNLPPPPTELPQAIRVLARAAFEANDDITLKSLLALARRTNPQALPQIEALEAEYAAQRAQQLAQAARERADRLARASLLDNWKGEIELGGSRSTGSTRALALYGSIHVEREGLKWRHAINGRVDFQQSNGQTTADRLKFAWQPNYKIDDALFIYGLGQYERDRFLDFDSRYTLSTGIGYTVLSTPKAKLSVSGGPALRYTNSIDSGHTTSAAGRASLNLRWSLTPRLTFAQDTSVYFEDGDINVTATTSLDTNLIGALKARFSYDIQDEHNNIAGVAPFSTTSRATLIYGF